MQAWYPGEQGAQAICEILFGDVNPSGKLPITFPRTVGQLPLFYAAKPSGRGYGYVENDGSALYPFGYGLSYTDFALRSSSVEARDGGLAVSLAVENTGARDGAEVVQIYLSGYNCDVAMPLKELKAYKRVAVAAGEKVEVTIQIPEEAFCYYDRKLRYGKHNGNYTVSIATSSVDIHETFEVSVEDGKIILR